jgi:outer membrane lipoprotein SlyB
MRYSKLLSITLITVTLAGCNPPPPGGGVAGVSKQDIGTVAGGVGGALIGSTMGGGNGRIATTAAGAILGGLAGSSVGKSLDRGDAASQGQ